MRYARTTNSTGNTRQRCMMETLGCGTASSALGAVARVLCIHHALVWFSTWPCVAASALLLRRLELRRLELHSCPCAGSDVELIS